MTLQMYSFDSFHISSNPWTVVLWTLKHMWIAHVKVSLLLVNDCFLFICFRELLVIVTWLLSHTKTLSSSDVSVSVQFSHSVMSNSFWPHEPQHARPPCPSPTAGVHPNPCPSSQWCHPAISYSVVPFSSCPQTLPASGSFPISQLFTWSGQSIGVSASASVLPMNIQDWSPSGWTGWISLQSKGFPRVFSNTTVQKHQFFSTQLSLWSKSHIHAWLLEKP